MTMYNMIVCSDKVLLADGQTGIVIRRDSQGDGQASYLVSLEDGQQLRVRDSEVRRVGNDGRLTL